MSVVSHRLARLLSIIAALAVLAAACGDSGSDAETGAAPLADSDDGASQPDATPDASTDGNAADSTDDAATADTGSSDPEPAAWPHTFVADQVGGGQLDANDLAGQDVILWFWAPW